MPLHTIQVQPLIQTSEGVFALVPVMSDYSLYPRNSRVGGHYHAVYHIVLSLDGVCVLEHDTGRTTMQPGDITVIDPGEKHLFITGRSPVRVFAFNFYLVSGAAAAEIGALRESRERLERIAIRQPLGTLLGLPMRDKHIIYERNSPTWERAVGLARGLRTTVNEYIVNPDQRARGEDSAPYAYQAGLFLLQLVSTVMPERFIPRAAMRTRVDPLVVAVDRYLRADLSRPYRLAELARHLDRAPGHVCSHFSRAAGTTIGRYLNGLRVRRACERLRRTDETITRIALDLGFSSPQHFSAAFKREMHVTPQRYRRAGEPSHFASQ